MIRYVDSAGWTWEVCELADHRAAGAPGPADARPSAQPLTRSTDGRLPVAPGFADRAARGQLYFLSRLGTRKLADYPPTWFALPRRDLEALCERAEEVA